MKRLVIRLSAAAAMFALAGFAAGETVVAEPDALLDYVEATGKQYIDTGVNAETGLKARIDFAWATYSGTPEWSLLAASTVASSNNKRSRIFMCYMLNGKPFFGYGKTRGNPAGAVPFVGGQRCEIVTDMSSTNSLELTQNGLNTFNATDRETFATNGIVNLHHNLFVFATNYGGAPSWYGQGKLYELQIFRKNATTGEFDLLRHYLPCIKDNRAGLYDKANGTISFSDGAKFIAGSVTNAATEYPAYLAGADESVTNNWLAWAGRHGAVTNDEYEAAFLLNVSPNATPRSFRIRDIRPVAGGAEIDVLATAGRGIVDLTEINGILFVEAGATVTNLVPKTIAPGNVSYDDETYVATVFVPESDGTFVRARIGLSAPAP